jgi:hypothetical protein
MGACGRARPPRRRRARRAAARPAARWRWECPAVAAARVRRGHHHHGGGRDAGWAGLTCEELCGVGGGLYPDFYPLNGWTWTWYK